MKTWPAKMRRRWSTTPYQRWFRKVAVPAVVDNLFNQPSRKWFYDLLRENSISEVNK